MPDLIKLMNVVSEVEIEVRNHMKEVNGNYNLNKALENAC
jgi:hypothetical protein